VGMSGQMCPLLTFVTLQNGNMHDLEFFVYQIRQYIFLIQSPLV